MITLRHGCEQSPERVLTSGKTWVGGSAGVWGLRESARADRVVVVAVVGGVPMCRGRPAAKSNRISHNASCTNANS